MKKILLFLILMSVNSFALDFTAKAYFDLSQDNSYKKLSKFLFFWMSYKGAPTVMLIKNSRTLEETQIEGITELSVSIDNACYKKLKGQLKTLENNPYQYVVFEGTLKELKLQLDKKSKLKFKKITNCYLADAI